MAAAAPAPRASSPSPASPTSPTPASPPPRLGPGVRLSTRASITTHTRGTSAVAFCPVERLVAVASAYESCITLLSVAPLCGGGARERAAGDGSDDTGDATNSLLEAAMTLQTDAGVNCLVFSPDGSILVAGLDNASICLFFHRNSTAGLTVHLHGSYVLSLAYSPNGQLVLSSSMDTSVKLWRDISTAAFAGLLGHTDAVWCVTYSPCGQYVATSSADGTVRLWHDSARAGAVWEEQGAAQEPRAQLIRSPAFAHQRLLLGHTDCVYQVSFSPDSRLLASCGGSFDCTVRVWDVDMGDPTAAPAGNSTRDCVTLVGHSKAVRCVAFTPDSRYVVSGSEDCSVRVWSLASQSLVHVDLTSHKGWVTSLQFSPHDRHVLATTCDDSSVRLLELEGLFYQEEMLTLLLGTRDENSFAATYLTERHPLFSRRVLDAIALHVRVPTVELPEEALWHAPIPKLAPAATAPPPTASRSSKSTTASSSGKQRRSKRRHQKRGKGRS